MLFFNMFFPTLIFTLKSTDLELEPRFSWPFATWKIYDYSYINIFFSKTYLT